MEMRICHHSRLLLNYNFLLDKLLMVNSPNARVKPHDITFNEQHIHTCDVHVTWSNNTRRTISVKAKPRSLVDSRNSSEKRSRLFVCLAR